MRQAFLLFMEFAPKELINDKCNNQTSDIKGSQLSCSLPYMVTENLEHLLPNKEA